jgi:hypothetical protein
MIDSTGYLRTEIDFIYGRSIRYHDPAFFLWQQSKSEMSGTNVAAG